LTDFVGSSAGTKLKSETGWNSYSGVPVGTDQYGFAALPGGRGNSDGNFNHAGFDGSWWSATDYGGAYAYSMYMDPYNETVSRHEYSGKASLLSVRCVQGATYTLTIDASAGGTVSPSVGAHTYDNGTSVSVTATANSGYTFKNWSGASTSTSATVNITMDGNKTLTANFGQQSYCVANPTASECGSGPTFVNSRDGKTYKKVEIGTQTWMGQNLNYDVPNTTSDVCYNNSADNCAKYGRLYNWATAMGIEAKYNDQYWGEDDEKHQGVCPVGWHVSSDAEWTTLTNFVGGASTAGTKLKSETGWNSYSGVPVGTDQYGFSALPGGAGNSGGVFYYAGNSGDWWSATEYGAYDARGRGMGYNNENVYWENLDKALLFSVRCAQD
jgi:uncharacterized protein (TIGR02145 family)/uncharacterized repeat protein (TIGR02543 family)